MLPAWFLAPHLFFGCWPTSTRQAYPLDWTLGQVVLQFLSPTVNRFGIHARDLSQELISMRTDPIGLHRHLPATLLFIQATEQQIHLPMQGLVGMDRCLLTIGTLTLVNIHD
jgi:hypothetical protein